MANNVPKIKLTEPQKLWLSAICSKLREGRQPSARALKVELRGKLPRDFDPSEIDSRLLRSDDEITLLGVGLLDPDSELIEKTNRIIQSVNKFLQSSPEAKAIGVDYIAKETKLPEQEVAHIFKELAHLGIFHDSGTNYGHGIDGWLTINIDKRAFYAYLTYESVQAVVDTFTEADGPPAAVAPKDSQTENPMDPRSGIDIFISHSSKDANVAEALVYLLRAALNLSSDKIRCTSVPGYMFDAGTPIDERIRIEVHESTVLIGLITPDSANSTYVLFELGARWGARRDLALLLASGADASSLPAPLAKHSALRCDDAAQVRQFVEGLATNYGFRLDRASAYESNITALVKKSKSVAKRRNQRRNTATQSGLQDALMSAMNETNESNVAQENESSNASQFAVSKAAVSLTQEVASWLLKDFFNGIINWLDMINKRFNQNGFVVSASGIQLYSDVLIYRIDFFIRETWESLLTSNAGEYFLNAFPSMNKQLISFGKKMDDFNKSLGDLERTIEVSPVLLRKLIDLYAKKMERERLPRSEFEHFTLEEIAARWLGELHLGISNYKAESKDFLVRFTAYALLELKVGFPMHGRRDDEIILNFTNETAKYLHEDIAVVKSAEETKLLYEVIKSESAALLGQLKKDRLAMSIQYKAPF